MTEGLDALTFDMASLEGWSLADDPSEKEWQNVPARLKRGAEGVQLVGHFEDIRRIDNLDRDQPGFWAALGTFGVDFQGLLPVDTLRYPVLEVTYRCTSSRALPRVKCYYPGGEMSHRLDFAREWTTAAVLVSHGGFPASVDNVALQLFANCRSTESVEFSRVRFRAMTGTEETVCGGAWEAMRAEARAMPPSGTPEGFLPFGVFMNASSAGRLADLMDISFYDYWRLAFEDIARHHHNCVALEDAALLGPAQGQELLALADTFNIKVVPLFEWPLEDDEALWRRRAAEYAAPFADSESVLAWGLGAGPMENELDLWRQFRKAVRECDSRHPVTAPFRHPGSLAAFAPHMDAAWFNHFKSDTPWKIGGAVRAHLPLTGGGPLWVTAPAFVSGSGGPEWNSCPQMRLMLNQALANGVRGWFAMSYHNDPIWVDGRCERSLTGPFLTFSDLWAELGNRVERLSVMAPLLMSAAPVTGDAPFDVVLSANRNSRSAVPEEVPLVDVFWMEGADFHLCYLVSNDPDQAVSINLELPVSLPDGMEIYDVTAFARTRAWLPVDRVRHLEMFPGQGQLLLAGRPGVCDEWRDVIARRILDADRRQVLVDLDLAQKYSLDIGETERTIMEAGGGVPLDDLIRVHEARARLTDILYASPDVAEARSLLIKASAIVCGCDEALSALHGAGKTEYAHELGVKALPLAREMTQLRIRLRRGQGREIIRPCQELVQRGYTLLTDIWAKR